MNLASHINQHVSLLATQTVDKAMVQEAEKLRQQFGEQVPPEALQALQMQRAAAIDNEIVKITEQMVGEEAEAMQDQNMDPLVLLKQQELAMKQAFIPPPPPPAYVVSGPKIVFGAPAPPTPAVPALGAAPLPPTAVAPPPPPLGVERPGACDVPPGKP